MLRINMKCKNKNAVRHTCGTYETMEEVMNVLERLKGSKYLYQVTTGDWKEIIPFKQY